jgi:holin-like protein
MRTFFIGAAQVAGLILFSFGLRWAVDALALRIPSSLLGLVILFLLLHARVIRLEWVEFGAKWLLAEMLLFFVPSVVGVIQYPELITESGVSLLLIIMLGTFIVMASTGLLARSLARKKEVSR